MSVSAHIQALALSEWVFNQLRQSLQNLPVARFYLREYWACAKPSSSFEVVGFFVLAVVSAKSSARQYTGQLKNLAGFLHAWTLSELEAALATEGKRVDTDLRTILHTAGKLPAQHSSRHSLELGVGAMRKLLVHPALGAHRTDISKAMEMSADEGRELLFPHLCFRASSASLFRRFLPKFRSLQEISDRHVLVYESMPPMVTRLDLQELLAEFPSSRFPDGLTVVLDLDETLVNYKDTVGLRIRPGAIDFLNALAEFARPVIFTAATEDYGQWAITQLELAGAPKDMPRLFRQHAIPFGPVFLKDLTRLGTKLARTVIVDNVRENFVLQSGNGVEISSWFGLDSRDRALPHLLPTLRELAARKEISVSEFLKTCRTLPPMVAHPRGLPQPASRRPH